MSDYQYTTESVKSVFSEASSDSVSAAKGRAFDRWLANVRADAVMGFATHYLKHDDWVKARQHANNIREGNT